MDLSWKSCFSLPKIHVISIPQHIILLRPKRLIPITQATYRRQSSRALLSTYVNKFHSSKQYFIALVVSMQRPVSIHNYLTLWFGFYSKEPKRVFPLLAVLFIRGFFLRGTPWNQQSRKKRFRCISNPLMAFNQTNSTFTGPLLQCKLTMETDK